MNRDRRDACPTTYFASTCFTSRLSPSFGAGFSFVRAGMATAAIVVAVSGFMLGGGLGESYAEEKYVVASNQSNYGANNELTSFFAAEGI